MEGDYPAAHAGYRRAFLLREEIGELRFRAYNLATLADLQNLEGDMAAALQSAQQAVQLCESFGDQLGLALARISLGRVQAALGQDETAHDLFKDALMTGRQSGDLRLTVEPLTEWGRLELAHGDVATAKTNFDAALAAFAKLNELHSNLIVGAWLGLGWVALADREWDMAQRRFVQTATATGAAAWQMLDAAAGLAEVYAGQRRTQDAAVLLELVANSPPTAAFTRRRAAETAARLGLKITAAPIADWRASLETCLSKLD